MASTRGIDADLRAEDQALSHGSSVKTCGRFIMPPPVISFQRFHRVHQP